MQTTSQAPKTDARDGQWSRFGRKSESIVISNSELKRLNRVRHLAHFMDAAVGIPGTRLQVGFDSLVGLIPGVGDLVGAAVSAYLIRESARFGVPRRTLMRMSANVAVDLLIGTVPVLGDVFDVGWKANLRNLRLLERSIEAARRSHSASGA